MNELNDAASGTSNAPIRPLGSTGHYVAPNLHQPGTVRAVNRLDVAHSDGGFNFSGYDSLGAPVKGFVQTEDAGQASNELERAGISVRSITERRGARKRNRRPGS